jgi:hypothetical protein
MKKDGEQIVETGGGSVRVSGSAGPAGFDCERRARRRFYGLHLCGNAEAVAVC